jgi:amphiphysin
VRAQSLARALLLLTPRRLNIFYLTLDKLQVFADGKYDISATATPSIEEAYVNALDDASERLEALSIRKPAAHSGASRPRCTMPSRLTLPCSARAGHQSEPNRLALLAHIAVRQCAVAHGHARQRSCRRCTASVHCRRGVARRRQARPAAAAADVEEAGRQAGRIRHGAVRLRRDGRGRPELPAGRPDRCVPEEVCHAVLDADTHCAEVVERTASTEDWWTGKLNGVQGVFPG